MRLEGKTALITGAACGIGKASAQAYARAGARVAIADIDFDQAKETSQNIGHGVISTKLDVTRKESIDAAVISLTQSAGLNLIEHGINVNGIALGAVDGAHWDEPSTKTRGLAL